MNEIREALTASFDKASPAESTTPPSQESGPPIEAVGTDETPAPGELPSVSAPAASTGPLKDPATGKFLPRGATPTPTQKPVVTALGATPPAAGTPEAPATTEAPKPATPAVKPPQSWRPEVREKWAALPPEVQQEVDRREREVGVALKRAAEHERLVQGFQQTVAPYEAMIRAEGGEPLKAVGSLLQTAAALRTAPPAMKAKLVANIIQQYGVPIDVLDAALSGQATPSPAQGAAPALDPEALLQQAEQRVFQRIQQSQQQALTSKAQQEAEAFVNSGEAEFIDDVRDLMANFLDAAGRSGVRLSLKDAYDRACSLHPEVSKVVEQRRAAQTATATQAATQKARAAASSVRSQPAAPPAANGPDDLRSLLEANWTRASGR